MRALTIDLEDWFQVYNFSSTIKYKDWDRQECRVVSNTGRILDILDEHDTLATFFVLGWTADKFPGLIKEIKRRGHELACHGYSHRPLYLMSRKEFEKDIDKAVHAIRKASGIRPTGYRAPSFSIVRETLWTLDILRKKGFSYDCSMVPAMHPDYGIRGIPRESFMMDGMLEIPMTTSFGLPVGGGYFRFYPYWLTRSLLRRNNNAVFYIHPWEFDHGMPRHRLPLQKRLRHYTGLKRTENKFRKLLGDFRFNKIEDLKHQYSAHAGEHGMISSGYSAVSL